jgi:hypothetical protein
MMHAAISTFPFFVGRGRSGTTLLRAMFDSHPDMAVPPESHFVPSLGLRRGRYEQPEGFATPVFLSDLINRRGFENWEIDTRILHAEFLSPPLDYPEAIRRLFSLYARLRGKSRYADKTPIYVLHLRTLARLFPEARFVHIIRDGRNVALSLLEARLRPERLEEAALLWRRFVSEGRQAGADLGPGRYRELRYEDLVEDPEAQVRSLCTFLGLPFDDGMLRYYERAEAIVGATPHHRNIARAPTKGLRDWRREMSQRDVALFEALAGDLLAELGYERATRRPTLDTRVQARRGQALAHMRRLKRGTRKLIRRVVSPR